MSTRWCARPISRRSRKPSTRSATSTSAARWRTRSIRTGRCATRSTANPLEPTYPTPAEVSTLDEVAVSAAAVTEPVSLAEASLPDAPFAEQPAPLPNQPPRPRPPSYHRRSVPPPVIEAAVWPRRAAGLHSPGSRAATPRPALSNAPASQRPNGSFHLGQTRRRSDQRQADAAARPPDRAAPPADLVDRGVRRLLRRVPTTSPAASTTSWPARWRRCCASRAIPIRS